MNDIWFIINLINAKKPNQIFIDGVYGSQFRELALLLEKEFKYKIEIISPIEIAYSCKKTKSLYVNNSLIVKYNKGEINLAAAKEYARTASNDNFLHILLFPSVKLTLNKLDKSHLIAETIVEKNQLLESYRLLEPFFSNNSIVAFDSFLDFLSYKLNVKFDEKNHWYIKNFKQVISVTKILADSKPALDLNKDAQQKYDYAGIRGTYLHNYIETFYKFNCYQWHPDAPLEIREKLEDRIRVWRRWNLLFKPESLYQELKFVDDKYDFAGTIDFVGKINNDMWIIDWKTQAIPVYFDWTMQLNAYAIALDNLKKVLNLKYDKVRLGVLHLPYQNGEFFEIKNDDEYREHFIKLRNNIVYRENFGEKSIVGRSKIGI